jgi:hypothetical protein
MQQKLLRKNKRSKMPNVAGKSYPYTKKGKQQAAKAKAKRKK